MGANLEGVFISVVVIVFIFLVILIPVINLLFVLILILIVVVVVDLHPQPHHAALSFVSLSLFTSGRTFSAVTISTISAMM